MAFQLGPEAPMEVMKPMAGETFQHYRAKDI